MAMVKGKALRALLEQQIETTGRLAEKITDIQELLSARTFGVATDAVVLNAIQVVIDRPLD